jgi:hypothetical protein
VGTDLAAGGVLRTRLVGGKTEIQIDPNDSRSPLLLQLERRGLKVVVDASIQELLDRNPRHNGKA